jgi:hypothetical protein
MSYFIEGDDERHSLNLIYNDSKLQILFRYFTSNIYLSALFAKPAKWARIYGVTT